jgi:hypothetical protein
MSPDGRVPSGAHHRRAGGGEPVGRGAGPGLPAAADRGPDGAARHAGNVGVADDADPRQRLASSGLTSSVLNGAFHDWIRAKRRAGGPRRRHHAGATTVPGQR